MYNAVLLLHSWIRWVVLLAGLLVVVRAWRAGSAGAAFSPTDRKLSTAFVASMDLQFLLGLLLYGVLSPITSLAFDNFGAAMKDGVLRFFAVEHTMLALAAVVLAHVGNARARRAPDDRGRFRQMAVFFTLALVLVLVAIPWPGRKAGRELFRFGSDVAAGG